MTNGTSGNKASLLRPSGAVRPAGRGPTARAVGCRLSPLTGLTVALLLVLGTVIMVFPFYWMAVTSLATPAEAGASGSAATFNWIPTHPQFRNYPTALRKMGSQQWRGFADALANSVVITTLCVIGQVLSCSLVGYAFARLRFRGREIAFVVMIATMMLPTQVTMIPMFILFRWFGWIDTPLPLFVPAFFGAPFFIFMFRQFFAQVPEALVEAARIDGCGHLAIWRRIMLPLCKPVIAITAIFTFIGTWNDFLGPLIYLQSEDQMTLAVALNSFQNQYGDFRDIHLLMAASIVTMIPCIVLFFVAQKQFVGGLSLGAVKG
jgi:multiple sugar transport system permease protein